MQPYPQDPQYYPAEQEYQNIPEDQANPVFFRSRRGPEIIVIPNYYPPYPYYPYPCPYPYPYYPYGGFGGFGGFGGGGWGY